MFFFFILLRDLFCSHFALGLNDLFMWPELINLKSRGRRLLVSLVLCIIYILIIQDFLNFVVFEMFILKIFNLYLFSIQTSINQFDLISKPMEKNSCLINSFLCFNFFTECCCANSVQSNSTKHSAFSREFLLE